MWSGVFAKLSSWCGDTVGMVLKSCLECVGRLPGRYMKLSDGSGEAVSRI